MHTPATFQHTSSKPCYYYTECLVLTDSGVLYDITFCPSGKRIVVYTVWIEQEPVA